jgi:hypothetical protein
MYARLLFVVVGIFVPRFDQFLRCAGQEQRLGSG